MSARVVVLHSFVRGTGKSTLTARLAAHLARSRRVAVIDADLVAPSLHDLLGLRPAPRLFVNDFLVGAVGAAELAVRVPLPGSGSDGGLFLVPASDQPQELTRAARTPVSVEQLAAGLRELGGALDLDLVLIDAQSGLSDQSLPVLALADEALLVLRLDHQDYQGTSVTMEVARRLGVPDVRLVVNLVGDGWPLDEVERKVAETYGCPAFAVPFAAHAPAMEAAVEHLWTQVRASLPASGRVTGENRA